MHSQLTAVYLATLALIVQGQKTASVDSFKTSSEITILTASATLQGREVRASLDTTFAQLYHDLDGGFTPLVRSIHAHSVNKTPSSSSCRSQNFVFPNLPLPSYRRRDVAQRKMAQVYIDIIKARRASADEVHQTVVTPSACKLTCCRTQPDDDMITALQTQEYRNGEPLTDKQIAHIMIALLMAGQHTSAATGSWALLDLARRPDIQYVRHHMAVGCAD